MVDHFLCDGLEERGEGHQLDCSWIQCHEVQDYLSHNLSSDTGQKCSAEESVEPIYTSGLKIVRLHGVAAWILFCEDRALVLEFLPTCMANAKTNSLVGLTILLEVLGAWLDHIGPMLQYGPIVSLWKFIDSCTSLHSLRESWPGFGGKSETVAMSN